MDAKLIEKRANDLAAAMLAKGMRAPNVTAMIKNAGDPCVHISWANKNERYGESYDSFSGATIAAAFSAASEFVAARPSIEEARLREFMTAVGKAIDIGKENGIDLDFLNPLVATMKQLSENIITDQRAA